jgi:uncharacterized protein
MMNLIFKTLLAGTAFICAATPSFADVKTGVDAWERGDFAAAVKEWRPLAVKGDADAQFNLAQAYRFGRGVPSDMKQAEDWYRRAATQGHVQAEDNLGLIMFQNGDTSGAMPLIERSANRGEPRAQFVFGTALFNGDMAKQDWPRAYGYMTRASAAGLSRASTALAQMDQYIPLEQRQQGLTIARQLEAQASRSKFAQVQPQKPAAVMSPPKMSPPRPQPKIATNVPAYPAPYPQTTYPQTQYPQTYPQANQPAYPTYPQASAPAPMPQVGNDPYLDGSPTSSEEPVVIPTRKSAKATTSRAQPFPNTRGALPSPRTSVKAPVKSQPAQNPDDQMDMPEPANNSGDWNAQSGANGGSGAGYPNTTYPSYPQDPAAGYPNQPYPNQPYPGQTYPGEAYPTQGNVSGAYPANPYPQPKPAVRTSPVRKAAPVVVRPVQSAANGAGNWRIQLGAFSAPNGADILWKSLRGRVGALAGKQQYRVKAGAITRLQAGGFNSRSEAEAACGQVRAAGSNCLVVSR